MRKEIPEKVKFRGEASRIFIAGNTKVSLKLGLFLGGKKIY